MIAIIDYGAGNLRSVEKAFQFLGYESKIITDSQQLVKASKVVLPGVGAFGAASRKLKESGFLPAISDWLQKDKSFLGICLGMQLLMQSSEESSQVDGIGFIEGTNLKFKSNKVPQIGWNSVTPVKDIPLFRDISAESYFYFVHSYYVQPIEPDVVIAANTDYGITYPCVLRKGSAYGVQFHPEKSGEIGLRLLQNWVELC